MSILRHDRRLLSLGLAATALVGTTLLIAAGNSGGASAATAAQATDRNSSAQQQHFSILRRQAIANDRMPNDVRSHFTALASGGADLGAARVIATPYGSGWLIPAPAKDRICLAVPDKVPGFGVTCQTTEDAVDGRLVVTMSSGPGQKPDGEVVGVLPDGTAAPEIVTASGARRAVQLEAGVVSERTTTAGELRVKTPTSGSTVRVGPEPEGALHQDCGDGRIVPVASPKDTPTACDR